MENNVTALILLPLALAAATTQAVAPAPTAIEGPIMMKMSQIKAYNAALSTDDPHYIRCLMSEPTGSLVKQRTCRTEAEWDRLDEAGNRDAQEAADYAKTHQFNHGEG